MSLTLITGMIFVILVLSSFEYEYDNIAQLHNDYIDTLTENYPTYDTGPSQADTANMYTIRIRNFDTIIDGMVRVCHDCVRTGDGVPARECDHDPLINFPLSIGEIQLPEGAHWVDIIGRNIETRSILIELPCYQDDAEINLYGIPLVAGYLAINVVNVTGAALRIDGGPPSPIDEPIFLPFNNYEFTISLDGYEDRIVPFLFNSQNLGPLTIELDPIIYAYGDYTLPSIFYLSLIIAIVIMVIVAAQKMFRYHLRKNNPGKDGRKTSHYQSQKKGINYNYSIVAENLQPVITVIEDGKKKPLLDKMNFEINKGDFICITGTSGKGKTVLLKMLAGYNRKYSGTLKHEGNSRSGLGKLLPNKWLRLNNIGYVPQHDALYPNTTPWKLLCNYYQLETGSKEGMIECITNVCERLGISNYDVHKKKIKNLSGGARKRVSIAIELLRSPNIILLDEPDSGLDPLTRHELYRLLRDINKQNDNETTVIFTTHQYDNTFLKQNTGQDVVFYEYEDKLIFGGPEPAHHSVTMRKEAGETLLAHGMYPGDTHLYPTDSPPRASKDPMRPPILKQLYVLIGREFRLYLENWIWVFAVTVLCMFALYFATDEISFTNYDDALATAFAIVCAAILIGLMMSINLVGKDYYMISRELHMGVSAIGLTLSKMFVVLVSCIPMSLILLAPYLAGKFDIAGIDKPWLSVSVFVTMILSAGLGLLVSTAARSKIQVAALSVPIIVVYQILFSGFVFERINENFRHFSISLYAIRAVGTNLGFSSGAFTLPYGDFVNSNAHHTGNLLRMLIGLIVILFVNVLFMCRIRLCND